MNEKHYAQMYAALNRISKYRQPSQLERTAQRDYGVSGREAIEMAYENVLAEATNGLRGVRKP